MSNSLSFSKRMDFLSKDKQSNVILAIDPLYNTPNLFNYIVALITKLGKYLCAIKLNFHIILPFSLNEIQKINVIADIKLNDIPDTNKIAIQYLYSMGFDSIIVNPFIGKNSLKTTVDYAHSLGCGIISLIYMSHGDAHEGFGASIINSTEHKSNNRSNLFYKIFYQNSKESEVDGVVIGGNRLDILKEFSFKKKIPIYSPGLITQGGDIKSALDCGADFLIIGRAILNSNNPLLELKNIHTMIKGSIFK